MVNQFLQRNRTLNLQVDLYGQWEFKGNAQDLSSMENYAKVQGNINFNTPGPKGKNNTAAEIPGTEAWLEVPTKTFNPHCSFWSLN